VRGLVRHQLRGGVDGLACGLEHRGHGVLREPDDLEVRPQRAQAALSRLSASERRAYLEAAGQEGALPEPQNRQQRRAMEKLQKQRRGR